MVVGVDEIDEESGAGGMAGKGAAAIGVFAEVHGTADRLTEATVEAFDHAVGLWRVGPGQAMLDPVRGAELVEGMATTGLTVPHPHIPAEAVGEL